MKYHLYAAGAILLALAPTVHGADTSRQATIIGGHGNGKCVVQVSVDGSAEVEIWGASADLRTISGLEAAWRGFQCTAAMPQLPVDLRLVTVSGRGNVYMLRDPRSNGGRAIVRIDDRQGGRANYTFELQWGRMGGPMPPPPGAPWPGFNVNRTIQACRDGVTARMNHLGFPVVSFGTVSPSNNPGPNNWVTGTVTGRRPLGSTFFSFSCSVDFSSGRVRSVDVQRR